MTLTFLLIITTLLVTMKRLILTHDCIPSWSHEWKCCKSGKNHLLLYHEKKEKNPYQFLYLLAGNCLTKVQEYKYLVIILPLIT